MPLPAVLLVMLFATNFPLLLEETWTATGWLTVGVENKIPVQSSNVTEKESLLATRTGLGLGALCIPPLSSPSVKDQAKE